MMSLRHHNLKWFATITILAHHAQGMRKVFNFFNGAGGGDPDSGLGPMDCENFIYGSGLGGFDDEDDVGFHDIAPRSADNGKSNSNGSSTNASPSDRSTPPPEEPAVPKPIPLDFGKIAEAIANKQVPRIGGGTFGNVYSTSSTCVAKQVKLGSPKEVLKFLREWFIMKTLTSLKHPNILPLVADIRPLKGDTKSLESGCLLLTQKCLCDIHDVMKGLRKGNGGDHAILKDENIKLIEYQLACGLQYLHDLGIIHRDLKPHNVFLGWDSEAQSPKVMIGDYGLARYWDYKDVKELEFEYAESSKTAATRPRSLSKAVFTAMWRAPEVFEYISDDAKTYTKAADVWSLGCMWIEINAMCVNSCKFFIDPADPKSSISKIPADLKARETFIAKWIRNINKTRVMPPAKINLMARMLDLDPTKRIPMEEVLRSEYFAGMIKPDYSKVADDFSSAKAALSEMDDRMYGLIKQRVESKEHDFHQMAYDIMDELENAEC